MTTYKYVVAGRRFRTLVEAKTYAAKLHERKGIFAAIEELQK